MARYGPPDDPNYPNDEPTAYINYGDHSQPPGEPLPWYRKPVALVAFGALGAVLIALIVFGLVKLLTGGTLPETPASVLAFLAGMPKTNSNSLPLLPSQRRFNLPALLF